MTQPNPADPHAPNPAGRAPAAGCVMVVGRMPERTEAVAQALRAAGMPVVVAASSAQIHELAAQQRPELIVFADADGSIDGLAADVRREPCLRGALLVRMGATAAAARPADEIALPADPAALAAQIPTLLRLKRAEEALRETRERFRALSEEIPASMLEHDSLLRDVCELTCDHVLQLDERGRIVDVNRAFATALGGRPGDFAGRLFDEFLLENSRETWLGIFERIMAGGPDEIARLLLGGSDGSRVQVEGTVCRRTTEAGTVVRAVLRDVTERARLEEQFLRTQRMESIGTLAGGIAHDLNNVLAPVLLCVGLIRTGGNDEERREFLRIIEKSALRGSDLVRQVLTFARGVEGERMPLHPKHIAREIVSILRETFPKTVRVVYDLPAELSLLLGNPTQLNQVLLNLCVNARDAMPQGGTLSIVGRNKTLAPADTGIHREARPGDYVVLTVADTGTGIPVEIRERIFDAFFTTKSPGHGTGLGLSTAVGIVRAHGGFIALESEVGRGTSFHVYLPAHQVAPAPASNLEIPPAPRGSRQLVLVVDDERPVRDIVERTLTDGGYRVITANDGIEAVARFMTFGPEIKLLVTDLLMPRLDGPSAIRAIRKSYPGISIIAMSGNPPDEILADPQAAGIDVFVAKPFTTDDLLHVVHDVLRAAQARDAAAGPRRSDGEMTTVESSVFNPA